MKPQTVMIQAVLLIRRAIPRLVIFIRNLGWKKGGVLALVFVVIVVFVLTRKAAPVVEQQLATHVVTLKTVAELSSEVAPLTVVGQVTSKSEATVRAEHSGQVVGVHTALGNTISAGAIAAELENGSERASVLQAQGSVEAAQANLSKVTGGARSEQRAILESGVASAKAGYDAARSGAVNALLTAYAAADSAITGTTDKMFTTPQLDTALFLVTSSDSKLTNKIESTRLTVRTYLKRESDISDSLTPHSDLTSEISKTTEEIRAMRNFVDLIVSDLNVGIPTGSASETQIATYLAQATAARATLTAALSSLAGATQGLASAKSGLEIAQKSLEQGQTGGQSEDVAAAKAAMKQAQGALAGAVANLEKTIIRAPISGTVNSFSLKRGDYVQQSSPVLTVANNGALEVLAYITESDARDIEVGQKVTIEDASGVVTRIAPALDPVTKKIEVRIGVDVAKGLINGQSVLATIPRSRTGSETGRITIPISALKMGSDSVTVFTVEAGKLASHEVALGALLGERVVVATGLTSDMRIVTDARGLREGEEVEVSDNSIKTD